MSGDINNFRISNINKTTVFYFDKADVQNFPADIGSSGIVTINNFGNFTAFKVIDSNHNIYTTTAWNNETITPNAWRKY